MKDSKINKINLTSFEFQLWEDAMQSVINCMNHETPDECMYVALNQFFQATENLNDAIKNDPELRINK
jgi:hypothetical protein